MFQNGQVKQQAIENGANLLRSLRSCQDFFLEPLNLEYCMEFSKKIESPLRSVSPKST